MSTKFARKEDFYNGTHPRAWWVVDAEGRTLGRLATQIAHVLRGKHKTLFSPHVDTGDFVIVVNAEKIHVSGKKNDEKLYYHHTCLLYTSPSPRDQRGSRMPSSA